MSLTPDPQWITMYPPNTPAQQVKSCATCKHLRGNRTNLTYTEHVIKWECFKAIRGINKVTGLPVYDSCESVRPHACNMENWWELYEKPVHVEEPVKAAGGVSKSRGISADDL